ncbi:hypothetical protein CDD83_10030 [Cordyceps sp. RAO-2017]|nr:hypothetical protein CDD83_10030 [Cordyceps sp. RAO-2017]
MAGGTNKKEATRRLHYVIAPPQHGGSHITATSLPPSPYSSAQSSAPESCLWPIDTTAAGCTIIRRAAGSRPLSLPRSAVLLGKRGRNWLPRAAVQPPKPSPPIEPASQRGGNGPELHGPSTARTLTVLVRVRATSGDAAAMISHSPPAVPPPAAHQEKAWLRLAPGQPWARALTL